MKDRAHLARISELGCIVCGAPEPQIHHIRHGQGMAQRASDRQAIPLCYYHHQGEEGIHTLGTRAWERKYGAEIELLRQVFERLGMP